jgi:glycosyltransferase involved in cell wall biosynthesis
VQLAAALVRLLREPELRRRMSDFGEQHFEQYDWPRVAQRFLAATTPLVGRMR